MSERRAHYEREGWLLVKQLVDAKTVQALLEATAELEEVARSYAEDVHVEAVTFEMQSASGRKGDPAARPGALRKIIFPSKRKRAFALLRNDPRIVSILEECGLARPRWHVDQVNFKLPRVGTPFPFHQDLHFLVGKTRGRIERHGGMNLVLALDPADAGNGGFEVLGRTQRGELQDFPYDSSQTNEGLFDETHRTLTPLEPGDAVFFHPLLAHGSGANRSDRPRRLVTLWFICQPP